MATKIVSNKTADHYNWGGELGTDCDGWHLVRTPQLSVIEELIPPGAGELRHFHLHARQFFFILEGVLTIEVEDHTVVLRVGEGVEVAPGHKHQVLNRSASPARMLVTSQPPGHGDRTNL